MGEIRFFMSDVVHDWLKKYAQDEGITMREAIERIVLDWKQMKKDAK